MVETKCYFSWSKSLNEKWPRKNLPRSSRGSLLPEGKWASSWGWERGWHRWEPHGQGASLTMPEQGRQGTSMTLTGLAESLGHSKPIVMKKAWDQAEILNLKVWVRAWINRGHAKALIWWPLSCTAVQTRGHGLTLIAAPKRWSGESPIQAFLSLQLKAVNWPRAASRRGENSEPWGHHSKTVVCIRKNPHIK